MAARIRTAHPLASVPIDSDLAVIFETEDLLLATVTRLQDLAECSKDFPLVVAYLTGLLEQRLFGKASDCIRHRG
ncbi:hypothetical protein [Trinickia acidisoli]|uniref:hypothetical protein n=1 Tax=Trinickia acidisoli TaxID=2767482 RepID=UPI001A8E318D|nr:hypothetical protein [Trinickia acidisoli]